MKKFKKMLEVFNRAAERWDVLAAATAKETTRPGFTVPQLDGGKYRHVDIFGRNDGRAISCPGGSVKTALFEGTKLNQDKSGTPAFGQGSAITRH